MKKVTALFLLLTLTILSYSPLIIKPQVAEASGTWVWDSLVFPVSAYRSFISVSADGKFVVVAPQNNYIYTSSDSGATWTEQTSAGSRAWTSITSSADGTKLAASGYGASLYISLDSGETWTGPAASANFGVASSADGTKLAATSYFSYVRTSSDSGETWTTRTSLGTGQWTRITSSADGTKLAVVKGLNGSGYVYTSTDQGETWLEHVDVGSEDRLDITSSSDGNVIYTSGSGNVLWRGTFTLPSHTLSFNTQGASPIPDITEDEGTSVTLPSSPTYEGYTFLNWNTQADGEGDSYQPGDSFTLNSDTTLYAIWEQNLVEEEQEQSSSSEPSRRSSSRRSVPSSLQAKNNTLNSIVLQYKDSLTTLHTLGIISLPQNILDILNIQTTNTTNTTFLRDLTLGDTGTDVSTLQSILISKGYSIPAGPTGYFGEQTRQAVAQFQRDNNITPAEGWFGVVTRGKMRGF